MNAYAALVKRASPSCAARMLREKNTCPIVRQLHLAIVLAAEEESPGQSTFSSSATALCWLLRMLTVIRNI